MTRCKKMVVAIVAVVKVAHPAVESLLSLPLVSWRGRKRSRFPVAVLEHGCSRDQQQFSCCQLSRRICPDEGRSRLEHGCGRDPREPSRSFMILTERPLLSLPTGRLAPLLNRLDPLFLSFSLSTPSSSRVRPSGCPCLGACLSQRRRESLSAAAGQGADQLPSFYDGLVVCCYSSRPS